MKVFDVWYLPAAQYRQYLPPLYVQPAEQGGTSIKHPEPSEGIGVRAPGPQRSINK